MKKLFLIVLAYWIFNFPSNIYSQISNQNDYNKFFGYFPENELGEESVLGTDTIPRNLVKSVLGEKFYKHYMASYTATCILNQSKNITFIMESVDPAGGYYSNYYIITFSPYFKLLKTDHLGVTLLEYNNREVCTFNLYSDTLLQVNHTNIVANENDENIVKSDEYKFYVINSNGFCHLELPSISDARKYPQSSKKILLKSDVENLTKEQLSIMRNEIFADHGYKFKSVRWMEYFNCKDWYYPIYEDVNDKLSVVEKINIATILKFEKSPPPN